MTQATSNLMTTHDRCPECGIGDFARLYSDGHTEHTEYTCGNHIVLECHPGLEHSGRKQIDGIACLRNQLANVTKEWEAAKTALNMANAKINAMLPVVNAAIDHFCAYDSMEESDYEEKLSDAVDGYMEQNKATEANYDNA